MNTLIKLSILLLILTCSACSSEKRGLAELKRLCEKDAGLTIYKTVEVDGYYDGTTICDHCWHALIKEPFKYIEFCDFESPRQPLTNILKDHGCYHLSKMKRDSGQCHAEIDEDVAKRVIEPYVSFKEDQCISVKPIKRPGFGVGVFLDKNEGLVDRDNFGISRYEYTIKAIDSNEKYGQFINYSLVVKTVGGAQHVCDSPLLKGKRVFVSNPSLYKAFTSKVIKLKNRDIL